MSRRTSMTGAVLVMLTATLTVAQPTHAEARSLSQWAMPSGCPSPAADGHLQREYRT